MPSTTGFTNSRWLGLKQSDKCILAPRLVTQSVLCPRWYFTSPRPEWAFQVHRGRVTIDGYARLKGVVFRMANFPLLYSPYILWPAQRDRVSGQTSLFDLGAEEATVFERPLPSVSEAPVRERLRWEKELLGLYLSEHPMGEIADRVGEFVTAYSGDLREESLDGQRLADEVRKWGEWIKQEAEKELVEFYPKDSDGATPIAYLWARTIQCQGPGCGAAHVAVIAVSQQVGRIRLDVVFIGPVGGMDILEGGKA